MLRHLIKKLVVLLAAALWLWTNSCSSYRSSVTGECCMGLSASLEDHKHSAVSGEMQAEALVGFTTRCDGKSVVARIEISPDRLDTFSSSDGGITWCRDPLYHEIFESWLPDLRGRKQNINWLPTSSENIKYRTLQLAPGEFRDERSIDGGRTWVPMNSRFIGCGTTIEISELTYYYHPLDPLTFYFVAHLPWRKEGKGMFITFDGGDSFAFMYECYGTKPILAVSRSNPKVIYASAVMGNIAKSLDAGRTWSPVGQLDLIEKVLSGETAGAKTQISDIAISPSEPNSVYLAASKHILYTKDGGDTWCLLDTGAIGSVGSMAIVPTASNVLLAGTSKGLFRSADAGCHWERIDLTSRTVN